MSTHDLPPLPEPYMTVTKADEQGFFRPAPLFNANDMHAYAAQAVAQHKEPPTKCMYGAEIGLPEHACRMGCDYDPDEIQARITSAVAHAVAQAVQAERDACRDVVEQCIRQSHLASNAREALSDVSERIYKRGAAAIRATIPQRQADPSRE